jgi:hypothetical protein
MYGYSDVTFQVHRQASSRLREHFSTPVLTQPIRATGIKEEEEEEDTLGRRRPQPM